MKIADLNIIEISEMIDHLDECIDGHIEKNPIVVGGIAGSGIEKLVLNAVIDKYDFSKVLVVTGCQDYIGMVKKPLENFMFYGDLFNLDMIDPITPFNPFVAKVFNPKPEYVNTVNKTLLRNYEMIIIFKAHLIDCEYLNMITREFYGQIIHVIDPFDINGDDYLHALMTYDIPVVVDSLEKIRPIVAMARNVWGVETRSIEKKVRGSVTETNRINNRSVGKLDDKQYVTTDLQLAQMVTQRQLDSPFRKGQKFLVVNNGKIEPLTYDTSHHYSLAKNSMLIMEDAKSTPYMKLRIYSSKIIYATDITYSDPPERGKLGVFPANIMSLKQSSYHRYNHTVLILTEPLTQRQKYSILKNSINVSVINKMK